MRLYEVGKIGSVTIFSFGKKQPRPLVQDRTRRIAGFRVSEQRGGLYLEANGITSHLVKGEKVVIFFDTQSENLAMDGALEVIGHPRGKCGILKPRAKFTIFAAGRGIRAWEGIAGDGKIKRGVHPQAKEID